MPPHPAVAAVRRAVRETVVTLPPGPLVVACSGGADSVALAAATAFVADRLGRVAAFITVDHGLQAGAIERAGAVAALGYELGFDPVEVVRIAVGERGGPEAAARTARYAVLDELAVTLDGWLLLGHTLDDQAETVLLGLGRGSGPRSIAGMRPGDGRRLRPLLGVRRRDTHAACAALGLPVWDDPHNEDPRFQRARLRHEVLPLLDEVLQGGVAPALARTATQLQDLLDALADTAERAAPPAGPLEVAALADRSAARRRHDLRTWALAAGAAEVTATHVAALDALVIDWHGQRGVDLPGAIRVVRRSGRLLAAPTPPRPPADRQD